MFISGFNSFAAGIALVLLGLALAGCGGDDLAVVVTTATATVKAAATPTRDEGNVDPGSTATPTPTSLPACTGAVAVQCASDCGSLTGCCAIAAPGGAYSCFDPSVTCDLPCNDVPANWIGSTQCGFNPGDDPSAACVLGSTPPPGTNTPTPNASTPTATPTPAGVGPTVTPTSTPNGCPNGVGVSFTNNNSYPVWLAEAYQGSGGLGTNTIVPPGGNWEIAAQAAVNLCLPAQWSGRFWPRTECDFAGYFGNDPDYVACDSASDCSQSPNPHICYGGMCMLDCSSGGVSFCQGTSGLGNSNAICVSSAFAGAATFCSYAQGVVCKTGDCQGLYQCYGAWDSYEAEYGATGPVSLFEPTATSVSSVNYDVSLVSGYNTAIAAVPSDSSCYAPGCVTDLNATCPANLQLTEVPTASGTIPCGSGTFCQSGACVGSTCVIGCNDPADQCAIPSPPSDLECTTYGSMYLSKGGNGDTMISGNQGTPTCWGTADCLPSESCNTTAIPNFPSGLGICVANAGGGLQPQTDCASPSDAGNACGGYINSGFTDAVGYTCVSAGTFGMACVPAFDPPVSGVGTLDTNSAGTSSFYSGTASPLNPTWLQAAQQAGGGTAWYEGFAAACPHQYGWTYDDHAGGFACTPSDGSSLSFAITFGPSN